MIRRLKKNEYEIKRALSIKHMIQDIEVSTLLLLDSYRIYFIFFNLSYF
jgi:hypothetical protein